MSLCARLAVLPARMAQRSLLQLSGPQSTKVAVCGAQTHRRALLMYIFFFVSTCSPRILTYYAMNAKHDAQQLEASSVRDDLLYGCCLHAALCVHLSHLCSGAPPLSPGNYFTPCFHLSPSGRKRLPSLLRLQSEPFVTVHHII